MQRPNRTYVISLGGSLIIPEKLDTTFLRTFKDSLEMLTDEGYFFVIIPGGGSLAREYQQALKDVGVTDEQIIDEMGIASLRLNAVLLRYLFKDRVHPTIFHNNADVEPREYKITIATGAVPGRSSDAGAVELAVALRSTVIINLSNVAHVYDSDPVRNKDATIRKQLTWSEYRDLIPHDWNPGLKTPFDPVAAKMAERMGLTVAIIGGHDAEAFKQFVRTGGGAGTLITP